MTPTVEAVANSVAVHRSNTARDNDSSMADHNFPSRLYQFLSIVDEHNVAHIASWQPHGRGFRIHNPKAFVKMTEPSWFVYRKYSSFQRQLHIYGFHRISTGIDKNCYHHKHFLRGHPDLLHQIFRCPVKYGTRPNSESAGPQPDFYAMVPLAASTSSLGRTNEQVRRDSAANGVARQTGIEANDERRLMPQSVSQFIQDHLTNNRDSNINNSVASRTTGSGVPSFPLQTQHNSVNATSALPTANPVILSMLEQLRSSSSQAVPQNNYAASILSQVQREQQLRAALNPAMSFTPSGLNTTSTLLAAVAAQAELNRTQQLRAMLTPTIPFPTSELNSTSTLLAAVAAQAEQNRAQQQLLQSIINRSDISQLLSLDQQQQQQQQQRSVLDAITSLQQRGLQSDDIQRILGRQQATTFLDDYAQYQLGRRNVPTEYDQMLRNSILPGVGSAQPVPLPTTTTITAADMGCTTEEATNFGRSASSARPSGNSASDSHSSTSSSSSSQLDAGTAGNP